jgi:hypothetical protein
LHLGFQNASRIAIGDEGDSQADATGLAFENPFVEVVVPQGLLEVIPTVVPSQVPSTPAASAAL